ncbi:MAG TPA: hypothetical protein PK082_11345, partial [Phycisphaerae bacterium]|nr:hypothetical protein [Phycisphaerae bacterium]
LLVVIAILALLVSILMPSLRKALDLARTVVCLNNMKQMGTGIAFYAEDHEGFCPPSAYQSTVEPTMGYWIAVSPGVYAVTWQQSAAEYFVTYRHYQGGSMMNPQTMVWHCPASPVGVVGGAHFGHYGINQQIGGYQMQPTLDPKTKQLLGIPSPASKFMLFDAGCYVVTQAMVKAPAWPYYYIPGYNPGNVAMYNAKYTSDSIDGRHPSLTVNVLYADCHGETTPVDTVIFDDDRWAVP